MKKYFFRVVFALSPIFLLDGCFPATYPYQYSDEIVNTKRERYPIAVNSYGDYSMNEKTFFIESGDKKLSSNDVEFREYADLVAKALQSAGANRTADKKTADLCLLLTYAITDESYIETIPVPIWGKTGVSSITTVSSTSGSLYSSPLGSGLKSFRSRTSSTSTVNPSFGITGYSSLDKKITLFRCVFNVYAYENNRSENPVMLWKTNLLSDGSSNDPRVVFPAMVFCGKEYMGKSSGMIKKLSVFEDQTDYLEWRGLKVSQPNVVNYPRFVSTNANPEKILIRRIIKNKNETIIEFVAFYSEYRSFTFSKGTFIEFGDHRYKVEAAENILLGSTVTVNESEKLAFRLIFPPIPAHLNAINISESQNSGWKWNGVCVTNCVN